MALLNIGDQAPDFQGKNQFDQQISLGEYKGRKVILYFYPKDSTPGCTAEACNLRDNNHLLLKKGFIIIGVSADSEASHQKFAEKYSLPFSLLADPDKKIINDYGVWGPKKFLGKTYDGINRTTYVISEDGKIEKVFTKVNTKDHAAQILEQY
jgi:peroxiredoxin Q/BCP